MQERKSHLNRKQNIKCNIAECVGRTSSCFMRDVPSTQSILFSVSLLVARRFLLPSSFGVLLCLNSQHYFQLLFVLLCHLYTFPFRCFSSKLLPSRVIVAVFNDSAYFVNEPFINRAQLRSIVLFTSPAYNPMENYHTENSYYANVNSQLMSSYKETFH